jgi:hypothetical protein
MRTPTAEQIQAFLDDLAVLIAAHGLVLDADAGGHMSLDPLPAGSAPPYGGYAAALCGTHWWPAAEGPRGQYRHHQPFGLPARRARHGIGSRAGDRAG